MDDRIPGSAAGTVGMMQELATGPMTRCRAARLACTRYGGRVSSSMRD